jgi:hypothetical protein
MGIIFDGLVVLRVFSSSLREWASRLCNGVYVRKALQWLIMIKASRMVMGEPKANHDGAQKHGFGLEIRIMT